MSDHRYNRSAEVVLHQPSESRAGADCLEKCLKVLSPAQRDLLWKFYGTENPLPPDLAMSILQLKTGTHQLRECLRKCLEESEDNRLPV